MSKLFNSYIFPLSHNINVERYVERSEEIIDLIERKNLPEGDMKYWGWNYYTEFIQEDQWPVYVYEMSTS